MAHDAEHGCSEDEPDSLLGDHKSLHPLGPAGRLRWVCGASAGLAAGPIDGTGPGAADQLRLPGRPGTEPVKPADDTHPADPGNPSGAAGSGEPADERAGAGRSPERLARTEAALGDSDRAVGGIAPARGGERSRLIPRPRPGEPDADDNQAPVGLAAGSPGEADGPRGMPAEPDGSRGLPDEPDDRTPGCRTDRPGWAGAHRHGAVRPSRRAVRRDRPPRRWC